MIVIIHVLAALTSVILATMLFFTPSSFKFNLSYGLVGLTIVSGSFMIIANHSHLLQSCLTGLLYLGGVSTALVIARQKYARQR